ncbi:hypothetical protein BDFB_006930 [Asbolus verrucosus]|uniref:Uncharacterized protein n=1 Tax=Asbolus verrucosus TaxID=1661398 RepID=A0A482WAV0_ASBVE|nr:hypothetical protein BDFB_006930 [Asbolus verrucosus]
MTNLLAYLRNSRRRDAVISWILTPSLGGCTVPTAGCLHGSPRATLDHIAGLIFLWLVGLTVGLPKPPDHASDTVMHPPANLDINAQDISSLYKGIPTGTKSNAVPEETTTPTMSSSSPSVEPEKKQVERYPVVSVSFQRVQTPFIIGLWIFCASLAKIGEFTAIMIFNK